MTATRLTGFANGISDPLVEAIVKLGLLPLRQMKEKLPVPLRPGYSRVYGAQHLPSPGKCGLGDLTRDSRANRGVAHDALCGLAATGLELRLDEHDRLPAGLREPQRRGQGRPNGDERDVADDELRRERQRLEGARVRPFEHRHAWIAAQSRVEL